MASQEPLEDFVKDYTLTLDNKNRVVMPAKFRKTIAARNPSNARHILYFTVNRMHLALPFYTIYDTKQYAIVRDKIPGHLCDRLSLDAQHRFIIPEPVLSHVRLKTGGKLILEASEDNTHIRMWSEGRWRLWNLCRSNPEYRDRYKPKP